MGNPEIGVVGLGVMGGQLARNLASRGGVRVAVMDRQYSQTQDLVNRHPEASFVSAETFQDLADALVPPRIALLMVPAGEATDDAIDALAEVFEPGDTVIDGGNAHFEDTIRREVTLRKMGIEFVGAGVSGGEEGALNGPSMMIGSSAKAWSTLEPLLSHIAAKASDGAPCVAHMGTDGAGHFVKMVHNGIEYADMQLIAEAYELLRRGTGKTPAQIADVFSLWNEGELESYLIEVTAEVLRHVDASTSLPLVDVILDQAAAKGTGAWAVKSALDLGVPVSGIAEAVFARSLSSNPQHRAAAQHLAGPPQEFEVEDVDGFIEGVRKALFASKMVSYSQGFDAIAAGAIEHKWSIDLATVAKIWRGGCIIRARFLDRIVEAYSGQPDLVTLMSAPYFADAFGRTEQAWRNVVGVAARAGVPIPAFSASLAYYDGLRADRLPVALIQAQRDFFGSHTYRRVDKAGSFHTNWSGNKEESESRVLSS